MILKNCKILFLSYYMYFPQFNGINCCFNKLIINVIIDEINMVIQYSLIFKYKSINKMDQPQSCTKCKKLPQDILMLACSHDLCLDCASQRLVFELKKKKPANSIVCEICYQRTALDTESISELEKLIPTNKSTANKSYVNNAYAYDKSQKFQRVAARVIHQQKTNPKPYDRQPVRDYTYNSTTHPQSSNFLSSSISSKKSCNEHQEQQILYFCFDCKCECICPECIIHGKHKDHNVKTIKKAHPLVKAELQACLEKIEGSIDNLLIKKSQVQKNIRGLNQQNSMSKRQIQQAFEEVRTKLAQREKDILTKCDINLNLSIEQLEKSIKTIIQRIDELKNYSIGTIQFIKKQQLQMLNFYAKKWKQINEQSKDSQIVIPHSTASSNQKTISQIVQLMDHIEKMGGEFERKRM